MKMLMLVTVMIMLNAVRTSATTETVSGFIGDTDKAYRVNTIVPDASSKFSIKPGSKILRIREVYPDNGNQPTYTYDITIGGRTVYKRGNTGTGFGIVSFFIYLPEWARKSRTLIVTNHGKEPVRIVDIQPVDEKKLADIEEADSFGLFGLVTPYHGPEKANGWLDELTANLPVKPGFYRGFSTELPYAAHSPEQLTEALDRTFEWAKERNLALILSPVSWWSGTPVLTSRLSAWRSRSFPTSMAI
jgi:hypothetical protein